MSYEGRRTISTTVVVVIVIILVLAAGGGVHVAAIKAPSSSSIPTTTPSTSASTSGNTSDPPCNTSQPTFCFPVIPKPSNATLTNNAVVTIGVLDDLSSSLSSDGIRINSSAYEAVSDVNSWIKTTDTSWAGSVTFNLAVEDYALDNTKAAAIMSTFHSQGISVVVGPLNSGTAGAILPYADSNQMVMISMSSTSVALAIPNDYLFRTVPNDAGQGLADARIFYQEGVRDLIIVFRQDTYGSGLANATAARFAALGGTVVDKIPYDTSTTDFSSVLSTLNTDYQNAITSAGGNKSKVAIQAITFEELGTMLLQARSSFPQLLNTTQPWYGSDGQADDSVLTNSTYASIMTQIRLPSTLYAQTNTTRTNAVCVTTLAETHISCDSYSLGSYDDVWLAALSVLHCGTNSGSCIQKALPVIANESVGVTGPLRLLPSGDRAYFDYNIWSVVSGPSGTAIWIVAGVWWIVNDTVTWTAEPRH